MTHGSSIYAPTPEVLDDRLPGAALLDLEARTPLELMRQLQRGLPARLVIERLRRAVGTTEAELAAALGLSVATLHRRKAAGELLRPEESARAYRLARLVERASAVLRSEEEARAWLREPLLAIGDLTPLEAARSEVGAELVLRVLGRLEHGVYT